MPITITLNKFWGRNFFKQIESPSLILPSRALSITHECRAVKLWRDISKTVTYTLTLPCIKNISIKAYREYSEYKNADKLLEYLLKVGNKYLGKTI
jgi:hypothetical protein